MSDKANKIKQKPSGFNKGKAKSMGKNAGKLGGILFNIAFWLFLGLIIFSFLTGYINQRETGESIVNYYVELSHKVGDFFVKQAEEPLKDTGLKLNDDGLYLEDSTPQNQESENGAPVVE